MIKKYTEQPAYELSVIQNIYGKFVFSIDKIDDIYEDNENQPDCKLSVEQVENLIKDLQKALYKEKKCQK